MRTAGQALSSIDCNFGGKPDNNFSVLARNSENKKKFSRHWLKFGPLHGKEITGPYGVGYFLQDLRP